MYFLNTPLWLLLSGSICGIAIGSLIIISKRNKAMRLYTPTSSTSFVFKGNLSQTSLLDAMQFLEIGRREGVLHVYCGRRKGFITFHKGKPIDASYRDASPREAVFQMLDLKEGDFYFEPKDITQPKLISDSLMDIAFEWDEQKNGADTDDG